MFTPLMDFYIDLFRAGFVTDLEPGDALRMKAFQKKPFQEDPTIKAPYMYVWPDWEKGLVPDTTMRPQDLPYIGTGSHYMGQEIGGAQPWRAHFKMRVAPAVSQKKEPDEAYQVLDRLLAKSLYLLQSSALAMQGVVFVNGARVENIDWNIVEKVASKVFGGENEWISYAEFEWFVRMKIPSKFGIEPR